MFMAMHGAAGAKTRLAVCSEQYAMPYCCDDTTSNLPSPSTSAGSADHDREDAENNVVVENDGADAAPCVSDAASATARTTVQPSERRTTGTVTLVGLRIDVPVLKHAVLDPR